MEQTSTPKLEPTPGLRRSRRAFAVSLAIPWLIFFFVPRSSVDESVGLIRWWILLYSAWWGFAAALARTTPYGPLLLRGGVIAAWISFATFFFIDQQHLRQYRPPGKTELLIGMVILPLFLAHWAALIAGVTLIWRSRFTVVNRWDQPELLPGVEQLQFSLRTLFYATTIIAVLAALLAALFRADLSMSESTAGLLFVVSTLGLWDAGLQQKIRWPFWGWTMLLVWSTYELTPQNFYRSHVTQAIVLGMILFPPLAYRWAGWRIVRREKKALEPSEVRHDALAEVSD